MNKNFILKADILDIVFEKRNKLYGAYSLRKFYPNRLKLALGLIFLVSATFSAFTFIPKKISRISGRIYEIPPPELKKVEDKVKEAEKKPEVKQPEAKPKAAVNQKIFTSHIVIVPKNIKTDTVKTLSPTDFISTKTVVPSGPGIAYVEPPITDPGIGGSEKTTPTIDRALPLDADAVDVLPSYPGGMDALRKFLEKNLQTPGDLENGETVSVRVKFVVDYNGKLKSFETVLDGGEAYNKEVVRVLKKMPDWVPGKAKGERVSVYHIIPVKFVAAD